MIDVGSGGASVRYPASGWGEGGLLEGDDHDDGDDDAGDEDDNGLLEGDDGDDDDGDEEDDGLMEGDDGDGDGLLERIISYMERLAELIILIPQLMCIIIMYWFHHEC